MRAAGQSSRRHSRQAAADENKAFETTARPNRAPPARGITSAAPEAGPIHGGSLSDSEIRSALARTLASPEFHSAPQLRAFLGFVVFATLDNQREKIKGYTIAVEALGRPEDFNPVTDPIVRVEAARLRRRLETYYSGSGSDDPVRIDIPKGSYAPEFRPAQDDAHLPGAGPEGPAAEKQAAEVLHEPAGTSTRAPGEVPGGPSAQAFGEPDTGSAPAAGAPEFTDHVTRTRRRFPDIDMPLRHFPAKLHVSLPIVVAVGAGCFLIGFLAGSL